MRSMPRRGQRPRDPIARRRHCPPRRQGIVAARPLARHAFPPLAAPRRAQGGTRAAGLCRLAARARAWRSGCESVACCPLRRDRSKTARSPRPLLSPRCVSPLAGRPARCGRGAGLSRWRARVWCALSSRRSSVIPCAPRGRTSPFFRRAPAPRPRRHGRHPAPLGAICRSARWGVGSRAGGGCRRCPQTANCQPTTKQTKARFWRLWLIIALKKTHAASLASARQHSENKEGKPGRPFAGARGGGPTNKQERCVLSKLTTCWIPPRKENSKRKKRKKTANEADHISPRGDWRNPGRRA